MDEKNNSLGSMLLLGGAGLAALATGLAGFPILGALAVGVLALVGGALIAAFANGKDFGGMFEQLSSGITGFLHKATGTEPATGAEIAQDPYGVGNSTVQVGGVLGLTGAGFAVNKIRKDWTPNTLINESKKLIEKHKLGEKLDDDEIAKLQKTLNRADKQINSRNWKTLWLFKNHPGLEEEINKTIKQADRVLKADAQEAARTNAQAANAEGQAKATVNTPEKPSAAQSIDGDVKVIVSGDVRTAGDVGASKTDVNAVENGGPAKQNNRVNVSGNVRTVGDASNGDVPPKSDSSQAKPNNTELPARAVAEIPKVEAEVDLEATRKAQARRGPIVDAVPIKADFKRTNISNSKAVNTGVAFAATGLGVKRLTNAETTSDQLLGGGEIMAGLTDAFMVAKKFKHAGLPGKIITGIEGTVLTASAYDSKATILENALNVTDKANGVVGDIALGAVTGGMSAEAGTILWERQKERYGDALDIAKTAYNGELTPSVALQKGQEFISKEIKTVKDVVVNTTPAQLGIAGYDTLSTYHQEDQRFKARKDHGSIISAQQTVAKRLKDKGMILDESNTLDLTKPHNVSALREALEDEKKAMKAKKDQNNGVLLTPRWNPLASRKEADGYNGAIREMQVIDAALAELPNYVKDLKEHKTKQEGLLALAKHEEKDVQAAYQRVARHNTKNLLDKNGDGVISVADYASADGNIYKSDLAEMQKDIAALAVLEKHNKYMSPVKAGLEKMASVVESELKKAEIQTSVSFNPAAGISGGVEANAPLASPSMGGISSGSPQLV